MTNLREMFIGNDGNNLDLANRLRTAEKETIFTHTNISTINHTMLTKEVGGGTATHNYNNATADLSVTTASGDKVTRQSHQYLPYLAGSPNLLKATGIMAASKANVSQRIGVFDDNDGLFFEDDGTGMGFVRRSSTSGSPVNDRIEQADWNLDTLDGNGASGLNVDWTDNVLYWIEYLWQGAVGYRAGVLYNGQLVICHQDFTPRSVPYMRTPSLPVRYEIENTGTAASGTTLKEVCVDFCAEGGHRLVGSDWAFSNIGTTINIGTTEEVVLVMRLKDTFNGNPTRALAKFLQANAFAASQDCHFRIEVIHNPTSVGATGWQDIDTNHSAVEYNLTQPVITGGDQHCFDEFTVPASNARAGEGFSESRFDDTHTIVTQNIDADNSDLIVLYGRALASTSDVICTIKFLEFE